MPRLPILKARELVRALQLLGFFEYHRVGSHAQFKHLDGRRTTIPIHQGSDVPLGTLRGILRDANIAIDEFLNILGRS